MTLSHAPSTTHWCEHLRPWLKRNSLLRIFGYFADVVQIFIAIERLEYAFWCFLLERLQNKMFHLFRVVLSIFLFAFIDVRKDLFAKLSSQTSSDNRSSHLLGTLKSIYQVHVCPDMKKKLRITVPM